MMMNDKQLRRVIASLSLLAKTGDVPIDALGVLSVCPGEKLADHLHQKWLSDESFYRLPAIILEHLHKADESDGNLMSCCLMHLLSDFRARETIRKASSLMFRNSVKVLTELYAVYRRIDEVLSECLIVPVFASLQMLAEKEASEEDVQVLTHILITHGELLSIVDAKLCDAIVICVRNHLCENNFTADTRRLLLKINDLWMYNWQLKSVPECIINFYHGTTSEKVQSSREEPKTIKSHSYVEQESVV